MERFRAYGWHVIPNVDGHSAQEVKLAIENARKNTDQPTLICCKTIIGFGSPNKQGKEESHGCLLYTSPSPRDKRQSRMPSSA